MRLISDDGMAFIAVLAERQIPTMVRDLKRTDDELTPKQGHLVKSVVMLHVRLLRGQDSLNDNEAEIVVSCANLCSRVWCKANNQDEKPYSDFAFTENAHTNHAPSRSYQDWWMSVKRGEL